ncbi:MAG: M48 family metallopeptidase [Vicinamibacterales bacterium]
MRPALVTLMLTSSVTAVSAVALLTVADEIEIGREAQQQVRREVPVLADAVVAEYVRSIGRRLAAKAGGPRYPYSFTVANQREINAFALPGGPVWVHRGAITAARNEAQLAGVVAHEIAHISRRHAADQMTKQLVANGLIGFMGALLGNAPNARTAQAGARILAGGYMLKFSRDDERDADAAGAAIMRKAGWDAREMAAFMAILAAEQGRDSSDVAAFLSSHPAPAERAARLRATVKRSGGVKTTEAFGRIKMRLARLPPAPRMKR